MKEQTKPIKYAYAPYIYLTEEITADDIRRYCRDIRSCGFNAVRLGNGPEYLAEDHIDYWYTDMFFSIADEAVLDVFPHVQLGLLGWMERPPHNVAAGTLLLDDEYQRLVYKYFTSVAERYRDHPRLVAWIGIGEPGDPPDSTWKDPRFHAAYVEWLRDQYGTLEACERAWGRCGRLESPTWHHCATKSWEDISYPSDSVHEKYRPRRDLRRFKTIFLLERMTTCERATLAANPGHSVLTGIHNVLTNQAAKLWDFELQASHADGLMSSIHNAWHAGPADFDFLMASYVQARITRDYARRKWAIPYETTGGPNFRNAECGFNMRAAEHWQMMMSYVGAGLEGGGFWTWNTRLTEWDAGEYAMTTLQGVPSHRAKLLGSFARKASELATELSAATPDLHAAVLTSWENEMLCSMDFLSHAQGMKRDAPSRNRIGAARALTYANIPWEFVTENELTRGDVDAFPVLIVPGVALVSRAGIEAMTRYVERGGRLIADMTFALYDEFGRVRTEGRGGALDKLLGAYPTDVYHTFNEPHFVDEFVVSGNFADLEVTTGQVKARFDDGRPAVIEHEFGLGKVTFYAFEVCSQCAKSGNEAYHALLADPVLAARETTWECPGFIGFRRRAPGVDHYFLLPFGHSIETALRVCDAAYTRVVDVIRESDIPIRSADGGRSTVPIRLTDDCGCWLRCERSGG